MVSFMAEMASVMVGIRNAVDVDFDDSSALVLCFQCNTILCRFFSSFRGWMDNQYVLMNC